MWCPHCRQDVPATGAEHNCPRCNKSTIVSAPSLITSPHWDTELRRVQRMVKNVDRLLADQPVVTRPAVAPAPSISRTRTQPTQQIAAEVFVDPTKTITLAEIIGMSIGLVVMIGSLVLSALLVQGLCDPHWAIALGLVVCVSTGKLLLFWQRIEQQERDLLLLRRYLAQTEQVDSTQLLHELRSELDKPARIAA
jgi:hypothetical protein